jgi:hypothetical protein
MILPTDPIFVMTRTRAIKKVPQLVDRDILVFEYFPASLIDFGLLLRNLLALINELLLPHIFGQLLNQTAVEAQSTHALPRQILILLPAGNPSDILVYVYKVGSKVQKLVDGDDIRLA